MGRYTYQKTRNDRGILSVLLFYILPFIIINGIIFFLVTAKPKYEITVGETHDYMSTTMTLTINSFLPTKNLSVTLNSEPLELEYIGKKTYTAAINQNGSIGAYLENFNGMGLPLYEQVSILDDEPPAVVDSQIEDGILYVTLSDTQSGIDFSSIFAIDASGNRLEPLTINKLDSEVTFTMDHHLTMYVKDMAGLEVEQPFSLVDSEETEAQ